MCRAPAAYSPSVCLAIPGHRRFRRLRRRQRSGIRTLNSDATFARGHATRLGRSRASAHGWIPMYTSVSCSAGQRQRQVSGMAIGSGRGRSRTHDRPFATSLLLSGSRLSSCRPTCFPATNRTCPNADTRGVAACLSRVFKRPPNDLMIKRMDSWLVLDQGRATWRWADSKNRRRETREPLPGQQDSR